MAERNPDPTHPLSQSRPYLSYLLRLWQETVDGRPIWRASVVRVQTGEQISFASWDQLVEFLVQEQRKEAPNDGLFDVNLSCQ